jgi:hypothetical protein
LGETQQQPNHPNNDSKTNYDEFIYDEFIYDDSNDYSARDNNNGFEKKCPFQKTKRMKHMLFASSLINGGTRTSSTCDFTNIPFS